MKRLTLLVAMIMAMAVLAPAAFAEEADFEADDLERMEREFSAAQESKAQMIADYFDVDIKLVTDLRTGEPTEKPAVGWGAIFKLMYAKAIGVDISSVEPLEDHGGYGFGNLLREGDFDGEFKNLGQLQKSYKEKPEKPDKPEKATPPGQSKKKDKAGR